MLLTGTYPRTLDDKKRIALPRRVRDQLGQPGQIFITPGLDQCLGIFNQPGLEKLAAKLDQSPATDAEVRVFRRLFFAQAEAADVDRNGRILIPDRLLDLAGLKHEVILIGAQDHLEVWNAERWQKYSQENASRFDSVAEGAFTK